MAQNPAPVWRLEACEPSEGRKWCLTVELPENSCPPSLLQHSETELRVGTEVEHAQVWRLVVPEIARPLTSLNSCKYSHRNRRLVVRWGGPTHVTQKPKVAGGLVSGHDERRDADTTRQLLELDKDEHQSCGEHAPAASALSPADFGDANPKDVKAHSLSIPHACSDLTKAEDTNGANASPVSTVEADGDSPGPFTIPKDSAAACQCFWCGMPATYWCKSCQVARYCSKVCQRSHWAHDHKVRCSYVARISSGRKQRVRGEPELAVTTLEDIIRDAVKALKTETEKEYTYSSDISTGLLRGSADATVQLATCLTSPEVPDAKYCRAAFTVVATFMDAAAALTKKGRPPEMDMHVQDIIAGLDGHLSNDADPVLSAWMHYQSLAGAGQPPVTLSEEASRN